MAEAKKERLFVQINDVKSQRKQLDENAGSAEHVERLESALEKISQAVNESTSKLSVIENDKAECSGLVDEAYRVVQEISSKLIRLEAETESLSAMLSANVDGDQTPIVDLIDVNEGYEKALSTALGDDLTAPIRTGDSITGKRFWTDNTSKHKGSKLPEGVQTLADQVKVPPILKDRINQIGIAYDAATAMRLQKELVQGQCLTTVDGGLWRWDGYVTEPGIVSSAQIRIQQQNRVKEIERNTEILTAEQINALDKLTKLRERLDELDAQEKNERINYKNAYEELDAARQRLSAAVQEQSDWNNSVSRLDETIKQLTTEEQEAEKQKATAGKDMESLDDIENLRAENAANREKLSLQRSKLVDARAAYDEIVRLSRDRTRRLEAISIEHKTWLERSEQAKIRIEKLESRKGFEQSEIDRLEKRPQEIVAQRNDLMDRGQVAEASRREVADLLAASEIELNDADKISRQADRDLAERREERIRTEAALEQVNHSLKTIKDRIEERLECLPEQILEKAGIDNSEELPDLTTTEARLERLTRERERIGPVNLRAEIEMEELDKQLTTMEKERDDLTGAISRLRRAISSLNKEGRDRLLQAFDTVNNHFKELFVRLFGGGTAHLTLVEADDPLDAGVEIMTSPPGKKLQSMSLLSGGEQALTALALVFAAFLTNPSPICVLDEVDAPLDDTNVDRFCSLLTDICQTTQTRFLIITHHRLTMARMDRLYGVTMAEQGISQLVSVNLEGAEELRDVV